MRTATHGVGFEDLSRPISGSPYGVLEGTKLCVSTYSCHGECPYGPDRACESIERAVVGAGVTDGCFTVGPAQSVQWTFTPKGCTTPVPAETMTIEGIAADDLVARFRSAAWYLTQELERWNTTARFIGAPLPSDDELANGPIQVFAPAPIWLPTVLAEASGGRSVGYNVSKVRRELVRGEPPDWSDESFPALAFNSVEGERFTADLVIEDRRWVLPEVVAVSADAPASLALTAIVVDDEPFFVLVATVRDRNDRQIHGVPVEWRDRAGEFLLGTIDESGVDPDIGWVVDDCAAPETRARKRHVIAEARYGDLSATVEFNVVGEAPDVDAVAGPWTQPAACQQAFAEGCDCRSTGGALGLLWLPLLIVLRRRS